jgi:DHA2 family multidrug resistance protein
MPVAGKLVNYIPARYLVAIGMALCSSGMWLTTHVSPDTSYGVFVSMRVIQVLGLPFLFVPISTLAFIDIPKEKSSKASAIFAMSRNLGGSMGIAILTNYLAHHQQMHQSMLTGSLTTANSGYRDALARTAHTIAGFGNSIASADHFSMGRMYRELLHQSDLLAFNDSFALMGTVMAVLVFVTMLMPHNNPQARKSADAVAAH